MHELVGDYLSRKTALDGSAVEVAYAFQDFSSVPAFYQIPAERTKPFGTVHALLCAGSVVQEPCCVINADDYYGIDAFRTIYQELISLPADGKGTMVGYLLKNTASLHGTVSRGVCTIEEGKLTAIAERTRIEKRDGGIYFTEDGENWTQLAPETTVSMNLFGFTSSFLREIELRFPAFLQENLEKNPQKCEFYLPLLVSMLLSEGKAEMTVLQSPDKWFGVTYAADKPLVMAAIRELTEQGKYPDGLWK